MHDKIYLTDDHEVSKQVVQSGNGPVPNPMECVEVHYEGYLAADGSKFDSSYSRNSPFKFILGEGKVISGWEIGIKTMQVGEVSEITCTSQYAYGKRGRPPIIPPNATLRFTIKLLSTKESINSPAYRVKVATNLKLKGNVLYTDDDLKNALSVYKQAKKYVEGLGDDDDGVSEDERKTSKLLVVSILANTGACYLKLKDWKNTIVSCEEVLKLDAWSVKAYYRLGQAYSEINDLEEAIRYLKLGLKSSHYMLYY
ncbi:putative 70 kDa peptidylprolyl isomerase [Absidia repens]|uniref:peptidylprolyl isomerase n=1 Tax=Absidia repens TaxID=90262 RepID=A0A1X2I436_9FUNG|nr:putative 70 kDa peptidylprolyl isomerase [Absidia repens]